MVDFMITTECKIFVPSIAGAGVTTNQCDDIIAGPAAAAGWRRCLFSPCVAHCNYYSRHCNQQPCP